jgi:hypothetical protein
VGLYPYYVVLRVVTLCPVGAGLSLSSSDVCMPGQNHRAQFPYYLKKGDKEPCNTATFRVMIARREQEPMKMKTVLIVCHLISTH